MKQFFLRLKDKILGLITKFKGILRILAVIGLLFIPEDLALFLLVAPVIVYIARKDTKLGDFLKNLVD